MSSTLISYKGRGGVANSELKGWNGDTRCPQLSTAPHNIYDVTGHEAAAGYSSETWDLSETTYHEYLHITFVEKTIRLLFWNSGW